MSSPPPMSINPKPLSVFRLIVPSAIFVRFLKNVSAVLPDTTGSGCPTAESESNGQPGRNKGRVAHDDVLSPISRKKMTRPVGIRIRIQLHFSELAGFDFLGFQLIEDARRGHLRVTQTDGELGWCVDFILSQQQQVQDDCLSGRLNVGADWCRAPKCSRRSIPSIGRYN